MDSLAVVAVVCAVVSTVGLVLFGLVDFKQWRGIRSLQALAEKQSKVWDERGGIGEQFGEWLLYKEKPEDPTNLELCAASVGHSIAKSFDMAYKGILSGEKRELQGVERKILESIQSPEAQALMKYCDDIGVPRELAGIVLKKLGEHGLLDRIVPSGAAQPYQSQGDRFKL